MPVAVRNPVDGVEGRSHARRIHPAIVPDRAAQRGDGGGHVAVPGNRLRERSQFLAGRDPAAAAVHDCVQIVALACCPAALTEQQRMAGGSVNALVERGNPRGEELDLRMADSAMLDTELAHPAARQILRLDEVEEGPLGLRHQGRAP